MAISHLLGLIERKRNSSCLHVEVNKCGWVEGGSQKSLTGIGWTRANGVTKIGAGINRSKPQVMIVCICLLMVPGELMSATAQ